MALAGGLVMETTRMSTTASPALRLLAAVPRGLSHLYAAHTTRLGVGRHEWPRTRAALLASARAYSCWPAAVASAGRPTVAVAAIPEGAAYLLVQHAEVGVATSTMVLAALFTMLGPTRPATEAGKGAVAVGLATATSPQPIPQPAPQPASSAVAVASQRPAPEQPLAAEQPQPAEPPHGGASSSGDNGQGGGGRFGDGGSGNDGNWFGFAGGDGGSGGPAMALLAIAAALACLGSWSTSAVALQHPLPAEAMLHSLPLLHTQGVLPAAGLGRALGARRRSNITCDVNHRRLYRWTAAWLEPLHHEQWRLPHVLRQHEMWREGAAAVAGSGSWLAPERAWSRAARDGSSSAAPPRHSAATNGRAAGVNQQPAAPSPRDQGVYLPTSSAPGTWERQLPRSQPAAEHKHERISALEEIEALTRTRDKLVAAQGRCHEWLEGRAAAHAT